MAHRIFRIRLGKGGWMRGADGDVCEWRRYSDAAGALWKLRTPFDELRIVSVLVTRYVLRKTKRHVRKQPVAKGMA